MTFIFFVYILTLLTLSIFSYGFVDLNFPLKTPESLYALVHENRPLTTAIFIFILGLLFGIYGYILRQAIEKRVSTSQVRWLIVATVGILVFSYPALSYDIFNYMATAKVAFFYKENPYLVMPIEFSGEPILKFLHAANKIALYGPVWILLTAIPHLAGLTHLILTVFAFKVSITAFYLGIIWLIWRLSNKNLTSVIFFAINPLVVIESLVSSHNDLVMMFFSLLSFYLLFQGKKALAFISLLLSIGIKYATVVLLPTLVLTKKFSQEKIFTFAYWLMFLVFLISPLREEVYPWYVIWLITFAALLPKNKLIFWLTLALSLGTLLRYAPFLYTGTWGGTTPVVKKVVTIIPLVLVIFTFFLKRGLWSKRFLPFW